MWFEDLKVYGDLNEFDERLVTAICDSNETQLEKLGLNAMMPLLKESSLR